MLLSDKILNLRKNNGFSQEELAEKLNVSRQSVSKWESAASIPDVTKIIEMAKIFCVSTDYLLRDDVELPSILEEEKISENIVTIETANEFLSKTAIFSKKIAVAVAFFVCAVLSILWVLIPSEHENSLIVLGLGLMFIFTISGLSMILLNLHLIKPFEYISQGNFALSFGVNQILTERKNSYTQHFMKRVIFSVSTFFIAVLSLVGIITVYETELSLLVAITIFFTLVTIGTFILIIAVMKSVGFDQLLKLGDYETSKANLNKYEEKIGAIFWPLVVAIYLLWSFTTDSWNISWVVWPVAGCIFAAIVAIFGKTE